MSTITLRIQDAKHDRLKLYATVALAQFDAETRFYLNSSNGNTKRGLEILDKLERAL